MAGCEKLAMPVTMLVTLPSQGVSWRYKPEETIFRIMTASLSEASLDG